MDEVIASKTAVRRGGKSCMKDYFDVLDIFKNKRMSQDDADLFWRKLRNDPTLEQDNNGLNPKFNERVEWKEQGFKQWFDEMSRTNQTVRSTADIKSAASDTSSLGLAGAVEEGEHNFKGRVFEDFKYQIGIGAAPTQDSPDTGSEAPTPKKARTAEEQPSGDANESSSLARVATARLLAYDAASSSFKETAIKLAKQASLAKACHASVKEPEKANFHEYLLIIDERLQLAYDVINGVFPDVEDLKTFKECTDQGEAAAIAKKMAETLPRLTFKPFEQVNELVSCRSLQIMLSQEAGTG